MSKCPNCGKPLDEDNLLKCPHCHIDVPTYIKVNLDNLKKSKDFLSYYKERIDAEVTRKVKAQIFKYIGLVSFLCLGGLFIIYLNNRSIAHKIIEESITGQFRDQHIKGVLDSVAIGKTQEIIKKELAPQIENAKKLTENEINSFRSYLDDSKSRLGEEYNKLVTEAEMLKERNRLAKLANIAISEGSRQALQELEDVIKNPLKQDLAEVAMAEIMRVKAFYATTNRIKGRSVNYASPAGIVIVDDKIPTDTLISELRHNSDWQIRAKFAELLASRKDPSVVEALLMAAKEDAHLEVVKMSLESFAAITGFKSNDVFDYASAVKWWNENQKSKH